jgi:hypothetical protein
MLAVSFNHILTLWNYDSNTGGSISFSDDLIHCDSNDSITHINFFNEKYLLIAHKNSVNVWRIESNNLDDNLLIKSQNSELNIKCVWSNSISDNILQIQNSPFKNQLVFFSSLLHESQESDSQTTIKSWFLIDLIFV